jgi:dienelactone hydrolase
MRSPPLSAVLAILATIPLHSQAPAAAPPDIVRPLPRPAGRFRVGTTVVYLTDSARVDSDYAADRPITLQLWYPANRLPTTRAPYLIEPGLDSVLLTGYYGVDSSAIHAWSALRTSSGLDAPAAAGRHPLLTFSVGLGVIRANYTSLAEAMASRGYVVALVESPGAGLMVRPEARVVQDTTNRLDTPAFHRAAVAAWAGDVSFALDRLQAADLPPAAAAVARTVDWSRVGAAGHSSGGLVAIAACERDPRVRACIDLDGGMAAPTGEPIADFVSTGLSKPTLLLRSKPIYSDADFARRGITRAEWEKRGAGGQAGQDSLLARSKGTLWVGSIAGTGHFSFTDAPFVMPSTISRFGGKIIKPERGLVVTTAAMRAFLDQELSGRAGRLGALPQHYPELTLQPAGRAVSPVRPPSPAR